MQDFESHPQTTLDLAQRHDIRLAVRQPVHRQENPASRTRDLLHLPWVSLTVTTYPGDYPGAQSGNQPFRPAVQSILPPLNPDILFRDQRSEAHTSDLHSLMRISYADFSLKTT